MADKPGHEDYVLVATTKPLSYWTIDGWVSSLEQAKVYPTYVQALRGMYYDIPEEQVSCRIVALPLKDRQEWEHA